MDKDTKLSEIFEKYKNLNFNNDIHEVASTIYSKTTDKLKKYYNKYKNYIEEEFNSNSGCFDSDFDGEEVCDFDFDALATDDIIQHIASEIPICDDDCRFSLTMNVLEGKQKYVVTYSRVKDGVAAVQFVENSLREVLIKAAKFTESLSR